MKWTFEKLMVKIKKVHFLWFTLQNWLGSRVVSVLDSAAEGPGFKSQPQRCRHCNGSLPPGLWLTSPAGWLPRTGISFGTLRSVIEFGQHLPFFTKSLAIAERAMRRLSWNLHNCHATAQKLLVRQVLNQVSAVANWPVRQNRAIDSLTICAINYSGRA